jgi:hypothetical protein
MSSSTGKAEGPATAGPSVAALNRMAQGPTVTPVAEALFGVKCAAFAVV